MWLLSIFLLIGAANWGAHLASCGACHGTILNVFFFGIEGIVKTLLWPLDAVAYLGTLMPKETSERPSMRVETLSISQNPGETLDEFHSRVQAAVYERIQKEK